MELNEEIIFKASVDTKGSEKSIQAMEKDLDDARKSSDKYVKSLEEIKARVDSGNLSMREMSKAIKDYQTVALNAGRETPVGQFAIQKAAELTDKIGDLRNEINRTAHDGKNLQGAMQIGSGVVAGYGAAQGAMALMGTENENLQKTFVKLQAVQSILMGIEQVRSALEKESSAMMLIRATRTKVLTALEFIYATAVGTTTGAMKALRLAMLALPIVAIIAGITALIMWLASLAESEEKAEAMNEKLTASYDRQTEALNRAVRARQRAFENNLKLMKAQGASAQEIHDAEIENMQTMEAERTRTVQLEKDAIEGKKSAYQQALKEENWELAKKIREEIAQHRGKYMSLKELDGQYQKDKKVKEIEFQNKLNEDAEKAAEKQRQTQKSNADKASAQRKAEQQRQIEERKLFEDLVIANIKNENERSIAEMSLNQEREREEIRKKYGKNTALETELKTKQTNQMLALIEAQDKAFLDAETAKDDKLKAEGIAKEKEANEALNRNSKALLEAKLLNIEDDFYTEQALKAELATLEMNQALENEKLTNGEVEKIKAEHEAKLRSLSSETAEHEKELNRKKIEDSLNIVQASVQSAQNLVDIYFATKLSRSKKGTAEDEKLAKKQFQINKALQLSGAIIDGAKSVTASLSSSPLAIGVVPNPVGIASLATAVTSSASAIAKIAATQFQSTSAGSSAASVVPPSTSAPVVTESQVNSTNTSVLQGGNKVIQVGIVDNDIKMKLKELDQVNILGGFG